MPPATILHALPRAIGEDRAVWISVASLGGAVMRVEVDPERLFPDLDREIEVWPVGVKP